MKRILFISSNIHTPWGGSEVLWHKTAVFLLLQKKGIKTVVIAKKWPGVPHHIQEITDAGGHIYDLPVLPATPVEYLRAKFRRSINKQKQALLQKISPDLIVHSMGKSFEGGDWMDIAHELAIPYVNLVQLSSELQWPGNDEVDQYINGYNNAHRNFFVSHSNRDTVRRQLGLELTNSNIVRNPILIPRKVIPYPGTRQGYNLALPAQLVPIHKGQDLLFDVLSGSKWQKRPIHLNLYGDGDHRKSLQRYSQYLGLNNIHFRGYAHNIEKIWAHNHILIMSSRMEGLPLTLVEAMSCGRAAIVTGVAGMTECVEDGNTGFIAKAAQPDCLDYALERAWRKKDDWQEMGLLAASKIKELIPFDPVEEFAETLMKLQENT